MEFLIECQEIGISMEDIHDFLWNGHLENIWDRDGQEQRKDAAALVLTSAYGFLNAKQ